MRYKLGDTVCIREDLDVDIRYKMNDSDYGTSPNEMMVEFKGAQAVITDIVRIGDRDYYHIDIDDEDWYWTDEMFYDDFNEQELPDPETLSVIYDWYYT